MVSAILGDIIGSPYEKSENKEKAKDILLIDGGSHITKYSVLSLAVANGLLKAYGNSKKTTDSVKEDLLKAGNEYANKLDFGDEIKAWFDLRGKKVSRKTSCTAACMVSSVAYVYNSLRYVERYAEIVAKTINIHPDSVKGAKAVAAATFLGRQGVGKEYIKDYITDTYYYDLTHTVEELRASYTATNSCNETFVAAFTAYMEGDDFEKVVRLAMSIGGNSNEVAIMAATMAGSIYEIKKDLIHLGHAKLDTVEKALLDEYDEKLTKLKKSRKDKFDKILSYKGFFDKKAKTEWYAPQVEGNESPFPFPVYTEEITYLENLVLDKDFGDFNYVDTLERYDLTNEISQFKDAVKLANPYLLKAILTAVVRQERFVDGSIADAVRFGVVSEALDILSKKLTDKMY
ncbi:MAG: ADP-ribosylglycohydrolase family protein [Lachnospiraceae bacterium]|nr:ADP-ribosylglycohydrolase family protein [Lachnospiraceae bacterium]